MRFSRSAASSGVCSIRDLAPCEGHESPSESIGGLRIKGDAGLVCSGELRSKCDDASNLDLLGCTTGLGEWVPLMESWSLLRLWFSLSLCSDMLLLKSVSFSL